MFPKNILIVDNGTGYLGKLKHLCGTSLKAVIDSQNLRIHEAEQFDMVLLSGGFKYEVMGSESFYQTEMELITRGRVPIVGVCLGFQLIAHAFGMPLREMPKDEKGVLKIQTTNLGKQILGKEDFLVFENHRWVVSKVPPAFHALAYSKDGIEAIQHRSLPVAGFQFHPEMFITQTEGMAIFRTVLAELLLV